MISTIFSNIWDQIWSPDIWLPPNLTWDHLKSNTTRYANFSDVFYSLPLSILFIVLRQVVERFVFFPIGLAHGLKPSRTWKGPMAQSPKLEEAYRTSRQGKLTRTQVQGLCKQLDCSERQIERWLRIRRNFDRPSKLVKFAECGWRFFYYTAVFSYGLWVLWDKPWFANISHCWIDYPHHEAIPESWWYYTLSQSFYWSLLISQFRDVKRKDFWEMFIHHVATIFLLMFSWTLNFHRIGTLILVVHDCADIFLEAAKMTKYIHWHKTCDFLFATFTFTWIITRLGIFPFWIVNSTTFEARNYITLFPAFHFMNGLLFTLLVLHIIWTYFIFKVLYRAIAAGQAQKDSRSSSSEEVSDGTSQSENQMHSK